MNNRSEIYAKGKMKMKQWIVFGVWIAAFIATLQFFRFKFGLFEIVAVYLVIGIPLMLLTRKPKKPNPK